MHLLLDTDFLPFFENSKFDVDADMEVSESEDVDIEDDDDDDSTEIDLKYCGVGGLSDWSVFPWIHG